MSDKTVTTIPPMTEEDFKGCPEKIFLKFIGGIGRSGEWVDKAEPGYEVEYVRTDLCLKQ